MPCRPKALHRPFHLLGTDVQVAFMKSALIMTAAALLLTACSPAPQDTRPPAQIVVAEQTPVIESLPSVTATASTLDGTFSTALARYVQSVAVCDHLTPGLLDAAKEELRASLGPELWSAEEEASTDYFRDGEGARIAAEMRAAIRAHGPGTRSILRRACSRDIADNKRHLIDAMEAIIRAAPSE
jgi:hypothetical protein